MPPAPPAANGKSSDPPKSWKKHNEDRKTLKRQRRQEQLEKTAQQEAAAVNVASANTTTVPLKNPSTVSIAVPGSILENAQSQELRAYVAGQVARAACIFRVAEIIVFDDIGMATARETKRNYDAESNGMDGEETSSTTVRSSSLQLGRILQYLECPQYLRKFFFPLHKDLKYSGLLNPLDTPHHLRQQNEFRYREGIIIDAKAKPGYAYANVGLLNNVLVDKAIAPGMRITVKINETNDSARKLRGTVVSPDEPRRELGVYWGYNVRIAHSFSEILTKSPYDGGYDLTIGTSDRGNSVHEVPTKSCDFNHLLIVFGGLKGLEEALINDDALKVDDPAELFNHYVNVLPKQGSRTIRTEEAILIALAALQEKLNPQVAEVEEDLSSMLPRSEDTGASGMMLYEQQKQRSFEQQPPPQSKKQKKRKHAAATAEEHAPATKLVAPVVHEKKSNSDQETFKTKHRNRVVPEVAAAAAAPDVDDLEVVPAHNTKARAVSSDSVDLSRFD